MKEFPIYRVISNRKPTRTRKGGMEIAVLVTRNVGGNAVLRSVNRHVFFDGTYCIGNHPDFYDGVDEKNGRAEKMFEVLDAELAGLTNKLEDLDEEIAEWTEQNKYNEMALETARECAESDFKLSPNSVLDLLETIRPLVVQKLKNRRKVLRDQAVNVGVKKEHAKNYLADVQRDFPRLVAYVHQK